MKIRDTVKYREKRFPIKIHFHFILTGYSKKKIQKNNEKNGKNVIKMQSTNYWYENPVILLLFLFFRKKAHIYYSPLFLLFFFCFFFCVLQRYNYTKNIFIFVHCCYTKYLSLYVDVM